MKTFTVTREDLKGHYMDGWDCPVSRSIRRTLGLNMNQVCVGSHKVNICGILYTLPAHADKKAYERSKNWWNRVFLGGFKFSLDIVVEPIEV